MDIEILKTATSFFCILEILVSIMAFLFADIAFNMTQVFNFVFVFLGNLGDINLSDCIAFLTVSMICVFLKTGSGADLC